MKKTLSLALLIFSLNIFSQKEANFWFFGENAGVDFNSNPPQAVTGSNLNTIEGCSSFSDSDGNLLFYSDGISVYNKNHNLMTYTDGSPANNLKGDPSSTQSGMIIPKPGSSTIYYLFTVDDGPAFNNNGDIIEAGKGLNYYTIDISGNSGNGELIDENSDGIYFTDLSAGRHNQWTEKVAAVRGKECDTFWVVSVVGRDFFAFKVDDTGVNNTPITSAVSNNSQKRGYLKLSPDGSKLAIANQSSNAVLYNFNNETGKVDPSSETFLLNSSIDGEPYGVEFSVDSKKLYFSTVSGFRGGFSDPAVDYNLYQFDLTASNIPGSKQIVHRQLAGSTDFPQGGFRGALQLGPDSKIYATIPLGYDVANALYLGAIENPHQEASKIVFDTEAIYLNGRSATQGLPPFISSLLLPIEIKDEDTNTVVNNEDLQFCVGDDKTITPATITGTAITYSWTFDDGSGAATISDTKNLVLTDLKSSDSGKYALKIELKDSCGNNIEYNASFTVEVFEAAVAKKPEDVFFCDTDRDGFNQFNLQDNATEILNGLNSSDFEVIYFKSLVDANSGDNALPNSYTNPTKFSSETIYARVQNINAPDACYAITDFILAVTDLPEPIQPDPYRICDDTSVGTDTDGIVNTFLLSTRDNEIYGSLDKAQYTLTYHTTPLGAENKDLTTIIPKNVNLQVNTYQTVYIRVENVDNTNCYDASKTLDLIVDPLPVFKTTNPEIEQCIAIGTTDPTVNLTLAEINISTNYTNETFEYYTDSAGTNLIIDPTSYPVLVNHSQSVYVKIISEFGCSRELIELKINVGETGNEIYNDIQPPVCDDFLDADGNDTVANSDTDNITHFSLDKNAIITGINPGINTTVFFYENATDRTNSLNEIDITNFRNNISKNDVTNIPGGIQFPIYYKILSDINNDCQGLGEFYVQINEVPKISSNVITPLEECDNLNVDGNLSNGSIPNIDLTQKIDEILQGTGQIKSDFTYSFYKSEDGALSGDITHPDFIPNPNSFTNDIPAGFTEGDTVTQSIFVNIKKNDANSCENPHAKFDVIIYPLPLIKNTIPSLNICDAGTKDGDVRNGLAQNINVSERDTDILNGRNASEFTITYHKTIADLKDLTSSGIDKTAYDSDPSRVVINTATKVSEETLYIRIIDNNSGCFFDQSTLNIIVNPEPTFEVPTNLAYCDNNLDDDDANGIIQNIDLDSKIPEILGSSQNPNDFNVTFHSSQENATNGIDAISSPYENSSPTETIYVRIQNKNTLCVNDDVSFDLIVNPLPDFTVTTPQILCLNDLPLNISVENARDVYTYVWTDVNDNVLNTTSTDNINVTSAGKYTVTATSTNGTMCSRKETIEIIESNIATLKSSFVTIIDESNNISSDANLSIFIDTITNNLGSGDYQFAILNTDNNTRTPMIGFQDEPLFEGIEGGIYQIIVNDKNGCSPDATLLVSVIEFPKFFTPNGDGDNDTFAVKGANKDFYPNASINIFNRFGKLIAQEPIDSEGWNGTYQGKLLPADDYWYNITLIPADQTKPTINKKGHFSLLRK